MLFNSKQTIPNYRRIKSREEYERALKAYFCNNKWFTVYVRKNSIGVSRLGIIVSKRITPKATNRNFAKRLIKEGFRRAFPAQCALDIVIRSRRTLTRETANDGNAALARLLSDIQIKCVSS